MRVLTAIDLLGVQRFIFSSNRLRDVVTGSYLVDWSTSSSGALENLVPERDILLAGGGNALLEFDSMGKAQGFTARYTRRLNDEVPGLEIAVVHKAFQAGGLARALQEIQIDLARRKTARLPSAPLLGLSVTAACGETGLPAVGFDQADKGVPLSNSVLQRRKRRDEANRHWSPYLEGLEGFAFPTELDDLGRTLGDTSLIGVVHADGNGVGEKIKGWLIQKSKHQVDDDTVRREYREWSQAIDQLGQDALCALVERICQSSEERNGAQNKLKSRWVTGTPSRLEIELKPSEGGWMLPLRPIVLGGDDLTFVCDGRIALDLAETVLSAFEGVELPHLGEISACAGVAVVRVHTPFAKAYRLAEGLCASAKKMRKKKEEDEGFCGCALDWHIGMPRPGQGVERIRERQYCIDECRLTCRPLLLGSTKEDSGTWRWLSKTLLGDTDEGLRGKAWCGRRSKAKALAELVREGPDAVRRAMTAWRAVNKRLSLPQGIAEDGFFVKSRTPLLDAVELLDLHLMLEPTAHARGKQEDKR
ncbi:Cas10/Cmr2 second palm domain-containing protein [Desulfatiglans anilini]|uniref:Cas10/Cmr2 second palm domain-containing protein n=1 Tax=Desulfatiglans anilini TaxID=90728 RepID=UPI000404BDEE|nr:hypothetical protein [Desulfatiglans anilini]